MIKDNKEFTFSYVKEGLLKMGLSIITADELIRTAKLDPKEEVHISITKLYMIVEQVYNKGINKQLGLT